MALVLSYPQHGRGAWSAVGGTLSSDGKAPGSFYRAPSGTIQMPGLAGYRGVNAGQAVDINVYAVYMGVQAIQREVGAATDGLFGNDTAAALKTWQARHGLESDGVFGPATAKAMFSPMAHAMAANVSSSSVVSKLVGAHVGFESGWDPGAVGYVEPRDLGLGQINGPAHSDLNPEFRLNPRLALSFVANFVLDNCEAMLWNERDTIAAYNLGVGGARSWVRDGRPAVWKGIEVKTYIDGVLSKA